MQRRVRLVTLRAVILLSWLEVAALEFESLPALHDPVFVVAFAGWNDAASAATDAARFVVQRLGARKFASIDPELFYDFREVRPTAEIDRRGARSIRWPKNEFYYARNPVGPHDVVIGVGVEPNLAWKQFAASHIDLCQRVQAGLVVSLGALLADVPHTRGTRVTGTALDPSVAAKLDLTTSRYQGPTGIVGVLHTMLRNSSVPAASLWANVPHYITTSSNPGATLALLTRLQELLGMSLDLRELEAANERFVTEVNSALSVNPEVAEYVRRLEEALDSGSEEMGEAPPGELPAGEELVLDVEEFLRQQREDE
jgi:proteasome assembly chaperone (PAC2) family protein